MNRKQFLTFLLSNIVLVLVSLIIYHQYYVKDQTFDTERIKAIAVAEKEIQFSSRYKDRFISSVPTDFINAANLSRESVVSINSIIQNHSNNEVKNYASTSGSGVIVTKDGYIVTNRHVVENADRITVILNNQKEYLAEIKGMDSNTDLALLKIPTDGLPYLVFGNSDSLQVGEWVLAVGNPFKLSSTVTAGIVSAKGRAIDLLERTGIESFIQTDAVVNRGNSGGALVNTKGELVGINTAIISEDGNYEGFSFAIPINLAQKIIKDLMEYGVVQRAWLGVEVSNVDNEIAESLNMKQVAGAYIEMVYKDGAADEVGLKRGDVILSVNDKKTNSVAQFTEELGKKRPGEMISLRIFRNSKEIQVRTTLKNQINTTEVVVFLKDKIFENFGLELRMLTDYEQNLCQCQGIYVSSVMQNSIADKANIEPGYIIQKVNGINVTKEKMTEVFERNDRPIHLEGKYENYPDIYNYKIE